MNWEIFVFLIGIAFLIWYGETKSPYRNFIWPALRWLKEILANMVIAATAWFLGLKFDFRRVLAMLTTTMLVGYTLWEIWRQVSLWEMLGILILAIMVISFLNWTVKVSPGENLKQEKQKEPAQVAAQPARLSDSCRPSIWPWLLVAVSVFLIASLWYGGDGWLSKNRQAAWEQPDVIVTGKPSGNDNPGLFAKWWESWHVRGLLYSTPAQRAELHSLFHDKSALRTQALASALTPQDAVMQTDATAAQTSVAMHKRGKGPLERMVNARAIQVPATDEVERLAAIARQRDLDVEVVKSILERGALPGEGALRFMRRIATMSAAKRLGVQALDDRAVLDRGPTSWAAKKNVPSVIHLNMWNGERWVMVPELAVGRGLGHTLHYDFESKTWDYSWTGKFRQLALKPN